jgi:hypothetical protein
MTESCEDTGSAALSRCKPLLAMTTKVMKPRADGMALNW